MTRSHPWPGGRASGRSAPDRRLFLRAGHARLPPVCQFAGPRLAARPPERISLRPLPSIIGCTPVHCTLVSVSQGVRVPGLSGAPDVERAGARIVPRYARHLRTMAASDRLTESHSLKIDDPGSPGHRGRRRPMASHVGQQAGRPSRQQFVAVTGPHRRPRRTRVHNAGGTDVECASNGDFAGAVTRVRLAVRQGC